MAVLCAASTSAHPADVVRTVRPATGSHDVLTRPVPVSDSRENLSAAWGRMGA